MQSQVLGVSRLSFGWVNKDIFKRIVRPHGSSDVMLFIYTLHPLGDTLDIWYHNHSITFILFSVLFTCVLGLVIHLLFNV